MVRRDSSFSETAKELSEIIGNKRNDQFQQMVMETISGKIDDENAMKRDTQHW